MANDPRNLEVFQAQRMESVHMNPKTTVGVTHAGGTEKTVFFRVLERIAGIEGGTGTSDYVESDVAAKNWLIFYVQDTYAGSGGGGSVLKAYRSVTGVRTWGGSVIDAELRWDTPKASGNARNMTAIQGVLTGGDGVDHPLGSVQAASFVVGYQNQSVALHIDQCTHRCIELVSQFGTGVTTNTALTAWSFIGLSEWGSSATAHTGWFLDCLGINTGGSSAWDDTHTTPANCEGYLRVRNPAGAIKGIAIYPVA